MDDFEIVDENGRVLNPLTKRARFDKVSIPDPGRSTALQSGTPAPAAQSAISAGQTIRLPNRESHKVFASVRIMMGKPEQQAVAPDDFEISSDDSDSISPPPSIVRIKAAKAVSIEDRLKPSDFYSRFVARTDNQCAEELAAPQKSAAWLEARKLCITASQFGAATGLSPYQSPDDLVIEKLWNTFQGNAATEWGNSHEIHAKESFTDWFRNYIGTDFKFIEENLMKFSAEPWMAVSPDGIVSYDRTIDGKTVTCYDLVEFKCPAFLRATSGHPYAKFNNIPPYYRAQTQGIMGYLNAHHPTMRFERCWFVVWQPHQTWITCDAFDKDYYADIHTKLESWYFKKFLPSLAHQHNGLLIRGFANPQERIDLYDL